MIDTMTKPSGFIRKASKNLPFNMETADLVAPHEGQGSEVMFLK